MACTSRQLTSAARSGTAGAWLCFSRLHRLRRSRFRLAAMREATPWSQLGSEVDLRMEPAFWARPRKAAWQPSSASWALPRARRHTPSTIGPCRSTRTANAASSLPATNRARSSRSPSSSAPRTAASRQACCKTPPSDFLVMPVTRPVPGHPYRVVTGRPDLARYLPRPRQQLHAAEPLGFEGLLDGLGVEGGLVLEPERQLPGLEVHLDRPLLYPRCSRSKMSVS